MLFLQGEMIYLFLVHLPFICLFLFIFNFFSAGLCGSGLASLEKLLEELLRLIKRKFTLSFMMLS